MKKTNTLQDKIANRIDTSDRDFFMRKDFKDIASDSQIGRSLNRLVKEGKIVKIGYGLYAKAVISPLSKRIVPRKSLQNLAVEFLQILKIEVVPSSYDREYNEGGTTQVPTGRVIGVKERISRKFGYDGKYVTFEYVS